MVVAVPLRDRCRGRWFGILTALGVHSRYLVNRHGPCPICGGKDRFRWDDKEGDGTFYCNQCGAGSGVDLVMRFRDVAFVEAAPMIEQAMGDCRSEPARRQRSPADARAELNALWRASCPVRIGDHVDQWMRRRGVLLTAYPSCLRSHPELRHSGPPVTMHPGMLAKVTDTTGRAVMLHRTFMTMDGAKAAVNPVRMFCAGKVPSGSAVRLAPEGPVMGIAEGLETALATMQLFGTPCWAALNAGLLEKFRPPPMVKQLVIYGDNDANQVGQRAAWALAAKLSDSIKVDVSIPARSDSDWNDVLTKESGR
jgi:putative DNA primase/helicase